MTILVTGGSGFIGSSFVLDWLAGSDEPVVNIDCLTYAANPLSLIGIADHPRYKFVKCDIRDRRKVGQLLLAHDVRAVINFAAESHVDRSIHDPDAFLDTNVSGTLSLLNAARTFCSTLDKERRATFRFVQVSTDEVYGSLLPDEPSFTEVRAFQPNSPYAASKAAADHFVRAAFHTYGLPVITTHCSNNYGPRQFPEKLIPLVITRALAGEALPIYGDGLNIRDWLYVGDHCAAIRRVLECGIPGERYNVGGNNEIANIDLVRTICRALDELLPDPVGRYERLITFVTDRAGHDRRYAIDNGKITTELGWHPDRGIASGIELTVDWYLTNPEWLRATQDAKFSDWMELNYSAQGAPND